MYTRDVLIHDFNPGVPEPVNTKGAIAWRPVGVANSAQGKKVMAAIPVARPNSSPNPGQGAPFWSAASYEYCPRPMFRSVVPGVTLRTENVEMDPSDVTTWRREYRFS